MVLSVLLLLGATSWAAGEVCLSPYVKRGIGQEKYLYVSCFFKHEIQVRDASKPERIRLHDIVVQAHSPT